jgi:hypothetical protein
LCIDRVGHTKGAATVAPDDAAGIPLVAGLKAPFRGGVDVPAALPTPPLADVPEPPEVPAREVAPELTEDDGSNPERARVPQAQNDVVAAAKAAASVQEL